MPFNPDWKQPLDPFSSIEGVIANKGMLTLSPWAVEPSGIPNFNVGLLKAFNLYLQLIEEPSDIDINVNYEPHKLFLGRYTKLSGNFVTEQGFINHRNVQIKFAEDFNRYFGNVSPTISGYVFSVSEFFGNTVFDIREIFDTFDVSIKVSAPIFQFGYDLNEGVKFYYVWL